MNDLNNVVVIGRITKDAELQYTTGGTSVSNFSIAVNEKYKETEHVSFFDVILWGKKAEAISKYLLKGKRIAVSGRLKQERWEKDGNMFSKVRIVGSEIQLLGKKENNEISDNNVYNNIWGNDGN